MDKTIMPLPLSSSRFSRLSPSPPPSSFLPRAAPQARLRCHRDGLPGRRPWTWARPRRPQDRLPREEAVAASSPVPASDGLPGRWPWPRRPQDRLPRACAALRPRLRSWSLAPPAPALASAARDAEWFNPAAHSWRRLERVRAPPSAAHVVFRGRVWCIEGNAMMEWMGTRRGWREVGPYPPGLKADTACAVYVGGGEKVVVTGALDGKGVRRQDQAVDRGGPAAGVRRLRLLRHVLPAGSGPRHPCARAGPGRSVRVLVLRPQPPRTRRGAADSSSSSSIWEDFGGTQAAAEMRCGPVLSSEEGQVWYSNQTAVTLRVSGRDLTAIEPRDVKFYLVAVKRISMAFRDPYKFRWHSGNLLFLLQIPLRFCYQAHFSSRWLAKGGIGISQGARAAVVWRQRLRPGSRLKGCSGMAAMLQPIDYHGNIREAMDR
nr:uncharacterized protein LOC117853726 [Setaria viridis]